MNIDYKALAAAAIKASENAYVPYSHFPVGAALLAESGKIYLGCNIENSSFGATICAERTAMSKAISDGEKKFTALAVAADHGDEYIVPCGICRQFICEFCPPEFPIILVKSEDDFKVSSLGELLPAGFVL